MRGACIYCIEPKENRVVQLLMGLNDQFGVVGSNVFAMREVSSVDVVYYIVS